MGLVRNNFSEVRKKRLDLLCIFTEIFAASCKNKKPRQNCSSAAETRRFAPGTPPEAKLPAARGNPVSWR